jgi:hypothetical protein
MRTQIRSLALQLAAATLPADMAKNGGNARIVNVSLSTWASVRFAFFGAVRSSILALLILICVYGIFVGVAAVYLKPTLDMWVKLFLWLLIVVAMGALIVLIFMILSHIPRRLIGVAAAWVGFSGAWNACAKLLVLLAVIKDIRSSEELQDVQPGAIIRALALLGGFLPAAIIYLELLLFGLWLALAHRDSFSSVAQRPFPEWLSRRQLTNLFGLPRFLSALKKNVWRPTALYALLAVLNIHLIAIALLPDATLSKFLHPETPGVATNYAAQWVIIGSAIAAHMLGLTRYLERRAARAAANSYQDVREWDSRAPILFLRNFQQDGRGLPVRTVDRLLIWPAGLGRKKTIDELLITGVASLGPLIALGDPESPISPLGAARKYVRGDGADWKSVVSSLIREARLIVVCPADSPSIQWELTEIREQGAFEKTVFLQNPTWSAECNGAFFRRLFPVEMEAKLWSQIIAVSTGMSGQVEFICCRSRGSHSISVAINRVVAQQSVLVAPPR